MAFHSLKSQAFRENKTEGSSPRRRRRRGTVIKWEEMHSVRRTEQDVWGLVTKKNERRKTERDRGVERGRRHPGDLVIFTSVWRL